VNAFGLLGFVRLAWPHVNPGIPFVDGWHIRELANHLEAVSTHDHNGIPFCRHLVGNVPPGSSKSTITSVCWPAFVWGPNKQPEKKWLFFCFDPTLASKHGRQCRELIMSEWFQERWPVQILDRGETDFRNSASGFRYCSSIRGGGTGRHADIIVVDDPIKPANTQGAASVTRNEIDFVKGWWSGTVATRNANPKTTARVIIMQRLHEEDLAGVCLESKKYLHLRLPMRYEADTPCRTPFGGDPRTVDGELLCPARWSLTEVAELEKDLGIYSDAQLQQRPSRAGGQIFRADWFRYWTVNDFPPGVNPLTGEGFDELLCSWDFTFKDTLGSDFVCGQVWGRLGARLYMLERVYERMNFPTSLTAIKAMVKRWPRIGPKLVEDKANGPAIIATLEAQIPGLVAREPLGSKVTRANAVSYRHRAGNIYYPIEFKDDKTPEGHVRCMTGFPLAKFDDSVDAETQLLAYVDEQSNTLFDALAAMAKAKAPQPMPQEAIAVMRAAYPHKSLAEQLAAIREASTHTPRIT